ncbi:unnamed protein product [Gongylonema pulchrum]|uniref:RRM domain-containing protein n=1 Tax=Gongylonema pulchrum TaxID=637853 RepID=A0A183CZZ8_9BILA|nr:unnamed protein product [Gongylonema pulchrum]
MKWKTAPYFDCRGIALAFGSEYNTFPSSLAGLMNDKATGQCKRYGFVDFKEAEDAQRAVEGLNQEGKVQAQMAKALSPNNHQNLIVFQQQEQDPTNLYLANLPPDFTETDLQKLLEGYGSTISTRVLKNGDGSSRCVGFARMDNEELCAKIIKDLNGKKVIRGCDMPLMVKYADSNKKLKARQSASGMYGSLTQLELSPPCYTAQPYEHLSGQYIRSNPNLQYLLPPSPYVYNAHPQYSMQGLSIHGASAALLQPPSDLSSVAPGTSMATSQLPTGTAIPQVPVHPAYAAFPFYQWTYGAATDPSMIGAVVTSTTPLQAYIPDLAMHTDASSAAVAMAAVSNPAAATSQVVYSTQPPPLPPIMQNSMPSGIVTVSQ